MTLCDHMVEYEPNGWPSSHDKIRSKWICEAQLEKGSACRCRSLPLLSISQIASSPNDSESDGVGRAALPPAVGLQAFSWPKELAEFHRKKNRAAVEWYKIITYPVRKSFFIHFILNCFAFVH